MPQITMVKKIKADGQPCRKCEEVLTRLTEANLLSRINRIVIADERDPNSEGMVLANQYQVAQAPFFIVVNEQGQEQIYTVYLRLLKEVLQQPISEQEENKALLADNSTLDFI